MNKKIFIISLLGLIIGFIFWLNKDEIKKEYKDLKKDLENKKVKRNNQKIIRTGRTGDLGDLLAGFEYDDDEDEW